MSALRSASWAELLGEVGRRLDVALAPPAPPPPVDVNIDATTAAQHVDGLTPRLFADSCRAGRWPSFRVGRTRYAKLADVLAVVQAPAATKALKARRAKPETAASITDELIASGRLRVVGGRR